MNNHTRNRDLHRDTSKAAYEAILPEIGKRQQEVLSVIAEHAGIDNNQIANILSMQVAYVSPRVHELWEMGIVVEAGKHISPGTKKETYLWKLAEKLPGPFDIRAYKQRKKEREEEAQKHKCPTCGKPGYIEKKPVQMTLL